MKLNINLLLNIINTTELLLNPLPELPDNRISFIEYGKENCINCEASKPHFNELKERIKDDSYHLRMRTINCDKYDCKSEGIIALPTYILYEGKKEIGRLPGMKSYETLADFLLANTNIDKESFIKIKHNEGVITLYERDFYNLFEGPWIILFYENKKDLFREMFLKLTKTYLGNINIAEIHKKNSKNVSLKYNIRHFPSIIAFNEGIQAYYLHGYNQEKLEFFINTLLNKSFQHINFEEFDELDSKLSLSKEPIFLLLYKNLSLANKLMKEKAHSYKMKTKIFRTSDEKLFERIGYFPNNDSLILVVYKNGNFFKYNSNLEDEDKLIDWLFHSHFPHLTKVDNDNFVQIFHGYKPVVLLLTQNDQFNQNFEDVINKLSHGMPYLNVLFATLNTELFPDFTNNLLPNIIIPSIVIYDTRKKIFFYKKIDLENNLLENLINLVKDFNDGKLPTFFKSNNKFKYFFFLLFGFLLLIFVLRLFFKNNNNSIDIKKSFNE